MNFKSTIKSVTHRIIEAHKKKELEVIVTYRKELIPFLGAVKKEFLIYKYLKKQNKMHIFLRKNKKSSVDIFSSHRQRVIRAYGIEGLNYRKPSTYCFVSTSQGVLSNGINKEGIRLGGRQLFIFS
jgi:hypothetical protein